MSIQALQGYTYYSRYARHNKRLKRRDTWEEAVDRVKNMHLSRFPKVREHIEWAFEQVKQKRVLGSQRALQFGGAPILNKHARSYNCTASYCDRIRFFQECFWLLLCGCGTGFSVQKHHVAKLPDFDQMRLANGYERTKKVYVVPDTIEGWADALGVLLATYFLHPDFLEWHGCEVVFDFSRVRPAGSPLASSIGKAPGPEPLKRALEMIRKLLDRCLAAGQSRLRPIDAYDIVMHASDAVLSGGVRRSATLCLFSPDDVEMATAKTGNWFTDNPQRGRSNNSALLLRDKTTREEFARLMEWVKEFGEPGFIWADSTEVVFNPCVEVSLYPRCVVTGESGWEMCNLVEINGGLCKTEEDLLLAAKAGAIIGTLQASYTNFEYLGPVTKRIVEREALLGVSMTGMMDNPDVLFDADIQQKAARVVVDTNYWFAPLIGINPTARATCLKPAGTTSCILGTASGIHPHHAKRYFRRVQGNMMEPPLQFFKSKNPRAVEKSVWSANGTDEVVTFCIEVPETARTKNDLSAVKLLEHVRLTQMNWVEAGTVPERCVQPYLKHNVSNTCFTGKTRFYTDKGLVRFDQFADGDSVQVINAHGRFVPAVVKNFGRQRVWELVLSNGKSEMTIETTANHIWLMTGRHKKYTGSYKDGSTHLGYRMVKTHGLERFSASHQIPKVFSKPGERRLLPEAFCHGFVFGDGSKHYARPDGMTHVSIFDNCRESLASYFADNVPGSTRHDHDDHIYIGCLPSHWKMLPNTDDPSYVFSFIAGWFAADGYIASAGDNQRGVSITCRDAEAIEWLVSKCQIGGIGVSGQPRSWVQKSGYKPGETYYSVGLVKSTLDDEFFRCHANKHGRWLAQKTAIQNSKFWNVVSCRETDRDEVVYCVVEPESASFVLEGNVLTHNCNVRADEWDAVEDYIYTNRQYFAGISLIPQSGDLDYPQAPMCTVHTPDEIVKMYGEGSLMASGLIVDGLAAFGGNLWRACDAANGLGEKMPDTPDTPEPTRWYSKLALRGAERVWGTKVGDWLYSLTRRWDGAYSKKVFEFSLTKLDVTRKRDWVRRAKQFADRYFGGDMKKMTWCLKEVNNWKLWCDLKREYVEVDYSGMTEEEDNTKVQQEWACSGQGCDLR
jgi:ribonucleoside-triphosphate reductase